MNYNYIAIEREYGSGGSKIGKKLSEETGIPCFGSEILEEVSKKYNISVGEIQEYGERATNSLLYSLYMMGQIQKGQENVVSMEGKIFLEEQKVIRRLAEGGKGIFLGHCASEALRGQNGVLNVFIHAHPDDKKERIQRDYGVLPEAVERTMRRFDKKRGNYFYVNTARRWNDLWQYDIVLDSSRLGIGGCTSILKRCLASEI